MDHQKGAVRPKKQVFDVNVGEKGALEISEEEARESAQCAKERIKKLLGPRLPSREVIEEHMLTHLPYRNWCEHCVKGRGREMDHRKTEEKRDRAEFHMDFCFPGEDDESEKLTTNKNGYGERSSEQEYRHIYFETRRSLFQGSGMPIWYDHHQKRSRASYEGRGARHH